MTTNTSYREQGRAVFLAAIMVLSAVAMGAAFAAPAAAEHEPDPQGESFGSISASVWQGQVLNISGVNNDAIVEVESENDFQQFEANSSGHVQIDTSTLDDINAEYDITDTADSSVDNFTLRQQEISEFSFDPSEGSGSSTMVIDSGRASYTVQLSADDISASEFDSAVPGGSVSGDHFTVSGDADVDVDFSELPTGEHEITAEVADSTASATATINVQDAGDDSASFDFGSKTENVGDVVDFNITTQNSPSEVWFTLADDREGFTDVRFNVTGHDNSDPIGVTWNTHQARNTSANLGFSVDNGNLQLNKSDGPAVGSGQLPSDDTGFTFDLEAYLSEQDLEDGDYQSVSVINIQQRDTVELNTWTAPGVATYDHDDNLDDILGDATERETVADGDLLIAEAQVSGVFGYLNTTPAGFSQGGLSFELAAPSGDWGSAASPNASDLGDQGAITIHERPDEDAVYFVIDSSDIPSIQAGSQWDATLTLTESNAYIADSDSEESVSDSFTYENRDISLSGSTNDDGQLELPGESDATVTADTNVAPNTDVSLRVNIPRDFRTASGQVSADGTFSASVDLSGLEDGTVLRQVRVRAPNTATQAESEGIISGGGGGPGPASFSIDASAPSSVQVDDDAQLEVTVTNTGGQSGDADITVEVGDDSWDVTETLDADGEWSETYDIPTGSEGDVSWNVDTQHDAASGTVAVDSSDDSMDDSSDDSEDDSSDDSEDDSEDDSTDDSSDDDTQPGFGLVVALFALIGAALLAVRRQN